ncbi:hypothetical protein OG795_27620 [[Kitasatospora] papulosa]|uniref:hypothetical protein n=1 Tax=Streptomyces sp. NPDC013099 TaxID=3156687 RepID=UPI0032474AB3
MTGKRSGGLRIVRLANFVTPASGGLRTALDELGRGYLAAGHEPVLIVPGAAADDVRTPRRPLARRQQAVNTVVHALSARYGAVHLHASDRAWTEDRSLWSVDRLHPGERGHRRLAAGFHRLLAERDLALGSPPGREPRQPTPTRAAAVLWPATEGAGRLARRSTDLLPQLLGLATAEIGHGARGTSGQLDVRAERALREARDGLPRTSFLRRNVPRVRMEG